MCVPTNISPQSTTSAIILSSTGSVSDVSGAVPFGIYTSSAGFLSGAVDQVAYTYRKLGGDVVDIELTTSNVYSAYEEACLEYSYIINLHQGKNVLSTALGSTTGTFNHNGETMVGPSGSNLRYPRFQAQYAKKIGDSMISMAGLGGAYPQYSASFKPVDGKQDYDLQAIVSSSAASDTSAPYYNLIGDARINVTKVYYKTPQASWRFYGYYGGLNTVGDLASYGQYSDDSTFQLVPVWQNKSQAMAFEDAIYTRNSHYSYEIRDNKLRIFPNTVIVSPKTMWVEFFIDTDTPWKEDTATDTGVNGINNMNTMPFENTPYQSINSIGKQWIRRFALSLAKEILGNIRSKIATIPIPGATTTLNGAALLTQATTEQKELREELKKVLDELTYTKVAEDDGALTKAINEIQQKIPMTVYVG